MKPTILDIPELRSLDARAQLIRIPPETDVPVTPRVLRLIDTPAFQRLRTISQLGLVSLVYPAARHSRMEHSLGVYRTTLLYLKQLAHHDDFRSLVSPGQAQRLIAAALLHDVGHWPFCHLIEDMRLADVPCHESLAEEFLRADEIGDLLRNDWETSPQEVLELLQPPSGATSPGLLSAILSGPIDVDKMDYLDRDSLHAGVPYGRHFDRQRLISSLCVNATGDGLAVTDKGRTAAELMVFARYVMFSEVYWHHAVRAATAMLQRAFFLLHQELDLKASFSASEQEMITAWRTAARGGPAEGLLESLFGSRRLLYKRLAEFTAFTDDPAPYRALAARPYPWLAQCGECLARRIAAHAKLSMQPHDLLIDAPPVKREKEFRVSVRSKDGVYRALSDVSPVAKTLASPAFDDYVKRVRILVRPELAHRLRGLEGQMGQWVLASAQECG